MLGTHKPTQAAAGVAHEGYGGWTWQRFVSHFEPNPDGTHRKRSSPFVYLAEDGHPQLDVTRYLNDECGGQHPDFVIVMLGINDCFGAPPDDPNAIDARIDAVFKQADVLLKAFRQAAPKADIGICLTTPPNAREAAFQANYKGRFHRWGWKRIQHRLVQRQLERFAGNEQNKIFIIPTQLDLDPMDGYPANNGVHPNAAGYKQIGGTIYAWIKSRLFDVSR
jgi:lysophospholipase L1-like esterase